MLHKDVVLIRLAYLNSAYRSDLSLLLADQNNNETKIINSLLKDGLVSEREIDKKKIYRSLANKKVKVIDITNKGRVYLSNKFNTEKYVQMGLEVASKYRTSDIKKLHRLLTDNRIRLIFTKVGVSVFDGKPSIDQIIFMRDSPEIKKGVYYSREEIDKYMNEHQTGLNDTYEGARFRGVFVNQEQVCMVYISNIEKNRVIRLAYGVENRAYERIKQTFRYTCYQSLPNAIVFSNTDSLMYNMAICGNNGHDAHDYKERKLGDYFFLNAHCDIFNHIYVFSHNYAGLDSLEKFCHSDHISFQQESCEIFDSLENFKTVESVNFEVFYGYNVANQEIAAYIPYYDIKLFQMIYKLYEDRFSIITFADMADNISHSIRKPAHYFDLEGNYIPVKHYLPSGDVVGSENKNVYKKQYKPRTVRRSFDINKKVYDRLSDIASSSYTSINKLVNEIILEYLDKQ